MTNEKQDVSTFFDRYARALSTIDVEAIAECYSYPALAVSRLGCRAIAEPEVVKEFFAANAPRYHEAGIISLRIGGLRPGYHNDGLWIGTAELSNLDADGNVVNVEHNAYQLIERDPTGWAIAVTTPLDAQ